MWKDAAIIVLFFCMSVTPKEVCRYYDVAEHLNLSGNKELFLNTIPKGNWKEPLEVGLDFTLVSILSVTWRNDFVSWNPSDFCNITEITLPVKLFWMPDIDINERADEDKFKPSPFVRLSYDGNVTALQVYQLTSSCSLDVHAFPFDKQKCNLSVVSSIHSEKEILLKNISTSSKTNQDSRKHYLSSGEWKFEKVRIIQGTESFETVNYSTIRYEISMTRRSVLHVLVLILPTSTLFLLDMAISVTAVSPGEMIAFKITLILEVAVLSLMLNDMLPATSDEPPVIGRFFTGIFIFMVLGILENALIMYLKEKKPKFLFFKDRKGMNRSLRKKTEDPVVIPGGMTDKISMENKQINDATVPETDSLVLLKQLSVEVQQIRKHLVLEEHQAESVHQEKTFLLLKKGLSSARIFLSICFLIFYYKVATINC